ncbi:MAG: PD-(D/E)XK nuclease family protein [Caulobacteraceae bacterium]
MSMNNWSISKDQVYHTCEVKFYFTYVLNARKNSKNEFLKEVAFLKKLKNIAAWKGDVFHDIAADFFRKSNLSDLSTQRQNSHKKAQDVLVKQWEDSFRKKYCTNRGIINEDGVMLFEHEYGIISDYNMIYDIVNEVKGWIDAFYNWVEKSDISENFKHAKSVWIEPPVFGYDAPSYIIDNIQIITKVDLAMLTIDNRFIIYDWKTGKKQQRYFDFEPAEFQVHVYQLWPYYKMNIPLHLIEAIVVYFAEMHISAASGH